MSNNSHGEWFPSPDPEMRGAMMPAELENFPGTWGLSFYNNGGVVAVQAVSSSGLHVSPHKYRGTCEDAADAWNAYWGTVEK